MSSKDCIYVHSCLTKGSWHSHPQFGAAKLSGSLVTQLHNAHFVYHMTSRLGVK